MITKIISLLSLLIQLNAQAQSDPIPGNYRELLNYRNKIAHHPIIQKTMTSCYQKVRQEFDQNKQSSATVQDLQNQSDECFIKEMRNLPQNQLKELSSAVNQVSTEGIDNFQYQSNSAFKTLQNYLKERIQLAFYGKKDGDNSRVGKFVEHDKFFLLYKDQLEQNILTLISSYCVNATPSGLQYKDPSDRKAVRIQNIRQLSIAAPQGDNLASRQYQKCLLSISPICGKTQLVVGPNRIDYSDDSIFGDSALSADIDYTRNQACIVIKQIREIRNSLMALEYIDAQMKNPALKGGQSFYALGKDGYEAIFGARGNPNEKNLDDLTSITSNELIGKSGLGVALQQKSALYEQNCIKNMTPECQKLLYSGADVQRFENSIKKEYLAQTSAISGKIKTMTPDQLNQFLAREGRTQMEIQRMYDSIKNNPHVKQSLNEIVAERFEKERLAIIKEMSEKYAQFNLQQTQNNLYNQTGPAKPKSPDQSLDMRKNVQKEIALRSDEIKETIHYHNIVTGYLTLTMNNKVVGQNVKSAFNELADSSYAHTGLGNQDPAYFQNLQNETRKNLKMSEKLDESYSTFGIDTINNQIIGGYAKEGQSVTPSTNPATSNQVAPPAMNR